jgi:hypothetical protein
MEISGGKICIKAEEYSLLILPPMTHIKENTAGLILDFYRQGGKLIFDTLLPFAFIEEEGKISPRALGELFGLEGESLLSNYLSLAGDRYEIIKKENNAGGAAALIRGPGLSYRKDIGVLGDAIDPLIERDVLIDSEDLFYLYRIKDGIPFYFVINPENHRIPAKITLRRNGIPLFYDLENGEIRKIWNYSSGDGYITIPWDFPPIGSAVFSFEEKDGPTAGCTPHVEDGEFFVESIQDGVIAGYTCLEENEAFFVDGKGRRSFHIKAGPGLPSIELPRQWDFRRSSDNALVIQKWKFAIATEETQDFYLPNFPVDDWLTYTMGGWELQLPWERDDRSYPVDVLYKIKFTAEYIPEDIKILIDGFKCLSLNLYINGTEVQDRGKKSQLDAEIREISIAGYLKEGINDISVRMAVGKQTHGLLDFVKLIGDFALIPSGDSYVIGPPVSSLQTGSWTEQGYPFYSGTGEYTARITIPEGYLKDRQFLLCVDCGKDVLEVVVNGREAGRRLWAPYKLDVSGLLREGENIISLKITNTMFNLLEAILQSSGFFGGCIECKNQFKIQVS